ncbi:MAG TPA: periplasmic heavy metal sensor [Rubrivivax sp.]|nr:periplasmic heavy metal sensor [Rubrivivax sp.]HPO18969.1 periplasmic heavy metal sensor [Rubrivivax sp.]
MKASAVRLALMLSLLANLGVLGAVAYRTLWPRIAAHEAAVADDFPGLARYLSLSAQQQQRWREAETVFIAQLAATEREILQRRNRLIGEIFAAAPDAARIEAERAGIARLQDERQRIVIEQLLRESAILDAAQRERLAQLLRSQPAGVSGYEQLHRN